MVENTRQGSKGGDELPQGDPVRTVWPVRSPPSGSHDRGCTTSQGPRGTGGTGRRKTQFLCHERDTMGPQIHPQGLGGGSRLGAQGKAWRSFLHPTARAGRGGAPDPQAPGNTTHWPLTGEASRLQALVPHLALQGASEPRPHDWPLPGTGQRDPSRDRPPCSEAWQEVGSLQGGLLWAWELQDFATQSHVDTNRAWTALPARPQTSKA